MIVRNPGQAKVLRQSTVELIFAIEATSTAFRKLK